MCVTVEVKSIPEKCAPPIPFARFIINRLLTAGSFLRSGCQEYINHNAECCSIFLFPIPRGSQLRQGTQLPSSLQPEVLHYQHLHVSLWDYFGCLCLLLRMCQGPRGDLRWRLGRRRKVHKWHGVLGHCTTWLNLQHLPAHTWPLYT